MQFLEFITMLGATVTIGNRFDTPPRMESEGFSSPTTADNSTQQHNTDMSVCSTFTYVHKTLPNFGLVQFYSC